MTQVKRRDGFLGAICLALWIGLLIAGLWPFNFFPPNHVSWLPQRNGVHFERYGEIYSPGGWIDPAGGSANGASLELWLGSKEKYNSFVPLLSIDRPLHSENFMIEQFRSNLIVEGRFRDQNNRVDVERLWMEDALRGGRPRFLTITSDTQGTAVYLEAALQRAYPGLRLTAADLSGRLLLGHPTTGHQTWTGDLFGLAFYSKGLTAQEVAEHYRAWLEAKPDDLARRGEGAGVYAFDERNGRIVRDRMHTMPDLLLPERFRVLDKAVLEFPAKPNRSDLTDGVVNVLGFIPFGCLVAMYFREVRHYSRGKSVLTAIALGGVTSLAIELLQVYLPTRDSSLLDLINNFVGSALGAVIPYHFLLRCLPFRRSCSGAITPRPGGIGR